MISRKVYLNQSKSLSPLREYTKLLGIVVPGILLSYLLMVSGLMYHIKAATQDPTLAFVLDYNQFTPNIKTLLYDILYGTFINRSKYVGPFWTIRQELLGSILITAFSICFRGWVKHNYIKISYLFLGIILLPLNVNIVSFIIGAFAFECIYKEDVDCTIIGRTIKKLINTNIFRGIMLAVGVYFFCVNNNMDGFFKPLQYIPLIGPPTIRAIGFALILLFSCKSKIIMNVLSKHFFAGIGSISAYIYAFHWQIILSVGCGLFLLLSRYNVNYLIRVIICSIIVLITTVFVSYLFQKLLRNYRSYFDAYKQKIYKK